MGRWGIPGQNVEEVLRYFGKRAKTAREKYQAFVADGISQGQRDELFGGGLRRVLKVSGNELITAYDDRILGSGDFVEHLKQEKEVAERLNARIPLTQLIKCIADFAGVEPQALCQRGRKTLVADIKSIICFLAARRIGYSGETIAKALGITRSGVCRAASRGAVLVAQNRGKWGDVERLIN